MRVVYISILPPDRHGVAVYGSEIVRALAKLPEVERVFVLANTQDGAADSEQWGDKISVRRCWTLGDPLSIARLAWRAKKLRPDVVHLNCGIRTWGSGRVDNFTGALLCPSLRSLGLRVVTTIHTVAETVSLDVFKDELSTLTRAGIDAAQRAYLASNVVTVPLKSMQTSMEKKYGATNVVHLPHGCYATRVSEVRTGGHVLLTLGYWGAYKNPEIVVKAVTALRARGVPAELVVAGGVHPYYPKLYGELVERYKGLDYVRFTGFVPDDALDALFTRATAVVLPYQSNAGASGVLNLARIYGRPVVISNEPALIEQHTNEGGAFLAFDSEASLTDRLFELLADPALQQRMGEANLAAAKALSLDRIAAQMAALYTDLPQQRAAAQG
jgi:glycosyltransferase involved in cell wall biosynthesis